MKNFNTYDTSLIEKVVKSGRKFILTGAIMISATGLIACNDENVTLASSYATEMEANFDSYDDAEQKCSIAMQNYLIAKDEYEQERSIENRVSLVGASRKMYRAVLEMTNEKATNAIGLDDDKRLIFDTDFENTCFYIGNKDSFDIDKSRDDFIMSSYKVDRNLKNLAQVLNGVGIYRGNGESDAWNASINRFIKASDELYKEATNFIGKDFSLSDDKISVSKEKTVG